MNLLAPKGKTQTNPRIEIEGERAVDQILNPSEPVVLNIPSRSTGLVDGWCRFPPTIPEILSGPNNQIIDTEQLVGS